jgi:hypothetical protein
MTIETRFDIPLIAGLALRERQSTCGSIREYRVR